MATGSVPRPPSLPVALSVQSTGLSTYGVRGQVDTMPVITARTPLPAPGTGGDARPMADGSVQGRIVADDPEAAWQVAQVLRERLLCDEPRSYPTGSEGDGVRLHLTVDTLRTRPTAPAPHTWLIDSGSQARRTHADETAHP